jgi:dCTP deaminase
MTVLSAQTIRRLRLLEPMVERQQHEESGCSFGLSACGYDVRLDQDVELWPQYEDPEVWPFRKSFVLASTMERFRMHNDVVGIVHDKSTWARRGIAVQNTVIEPGWCGYLTLEITNHGPEVVQMAAGTPIAQVLFHQLDEATERPYPETGKYQNQERGAQSARDGRGHG